MLMVQHKTTDSGDVKDRVDSAFPVPKRVQVPKARTPLLDYDFEEDGLAIPDEVPEWIREIIQRSPEYIALSNSPKKK